MGITVKSARELERMRRAGRIVALTIQALRQAVRPGVRTRELDSLAEREITRLGGRPAFKGYRGFPATICVSINEEIVHGIPGDRMVREGDIVSLDVGAIVDGFYGDAAVTVAAGQVPDEVRRLLEVTEGALHAGIRAARAGARVGDVSAAVEAFVASRGQYGVVRQYVGHGIGRLLHEEPQVPNYGPPGLGVLLRPGMTIAIEPMVNLGTWETRVLGDDWTVVTADGSLSAHFEHTIAITDGEPQVLTVP
ncbi:MAG: type I methionyl aminopeptidase [Chloroflexi bacterium]|nr:type I methionyl aminopeptidase [Chloroflexota bacterium]